MRIWLMAVSVLILSMTAVRADDKKEEPKVPALPIKAMLTAKKTTFTLDLGGKSAEEYKKDARDC